MSAARAEVAIHNALQLMILQQGREIGKIGREIFRGNCCILPPCRRLLSISEPGRQTRPIFPYAPKVCPLSWIRDGQPFEEISALAEILQKIVGLPPNVFWILTV